MNQNKKGRHLVHPVHIKEILLAKHAQHVVLIHFPIALFIAAVVFDFVAQMTKRSRLADAAYYNLLAAATSTFPVLVTGVLAWQFQFEGQKLKGFLLLHLGFACASTVMIWLAWWMHRRARSRAEGLPGYRWPIEILGIALVALTGYLGGVLSGVNRTG